MERDAEPHVHHLAQGDSRHAPPSKGCSQNSARTPGRQATVAYRAVRAVWDWRQGTALQPQKDQRAQQQLLEQKLQTLKAAQSALATAERKKDAVELRCQILQDEVARLSEINSSQAEYAQNLQEHLVEAVAHLKLLGRSRLTRSSKRPINARTRIWP
jgi:hypothetical protein